MIKSWKAMFDKKEYFPLACFINQNTADLIKSKKTTEYC